MTVRGREGLLNWWWLCGPVIRDGVRRSRLFFATSAICFILLTVLFNGGDRLSSGSSCRRLFNLSQARMYWERPAADSPTTCLGSGVPPRHATPCLTELRRRRGRPAFVMFIGDSRARILFMKLRVELRLLWKRRILHDVYHSQKNATFVERGKRLRCPEAITMFHGTKWEKWVCHLDVSSDLVRATFDWAPFVSSGYLDRLAVVDEDCRQGLACPDLIVMTTGIWYAKLPDIRRLRKFERPVWFAHEAHRLVPVLRNLSDYTQLVYRVDGPHFMEGYGNKSTLNGVILAINAAVMSTLNKVPGLQLWTSSLAETVRFQHTMCLQLAAVHTPVLGKHRHECMDDNHVAEAVQLSAAGAIVRFLCRETVQHPAGHCCEPQT